MCSVEHYIGKTQSEKVGAPYPEVVQDFQRTGDVIRGDFHALLGGGSIQHPNGLHHMRPDAAVHCAYRVVQVIAVYSAEQNLDTKEKYSIQ
jgi:hypothetical protein